MHVLNFCAVIFISFLYVFYFAFIYFISFPINLNISVKHIFFLFSLLYSRSITDVSCDGVNLSIGSNLKLAPVPCAISEWPILCHLGPPYSFLCDYCACA